MFLILKIPWSMRIEIVIRSYCYRPKSDGPKNWSTSHFTNLSHFSGSTLIIGFQKCYLTLNRRIMINLMSVIMIGHFWSPLWQSGKVAKWHSGKVAKWSHSVLPHPVVEPLSPGLKTQTLAEWPWACSGPQFESSFSRILLGQSLRWPIFASRVGQNWMLP